MLMFAAMLAPVSQATYAVYSTNTDDPTFTVKASLQVNKFTDSNYMRNAYATLRFDETGIGDLMIYELDMGISVYVTGKVSDTISNSELNVSEGDYINIDVTTFTEEQGVTSLTGTYLAKVNGTKIFYNPPSITIHVRDIS